MKYNIEQCIGNRLRCLSRVVDRDFRASLKAFNITESQLSILFALTKLGKVDQGKIGEALFLERSTVSRNIKLLEKRGVLTKSSDYRPEIAITKKGLDLVQSIMPIWESLMTSFMDKLGHEGIESIKSLEQKLY
ncbi:MarR family winged helix-turn-helix transcriptional regulator [Flavivirga algicola]|uniref:Winged helix-turn-helix transcriptional regulator n=1 Tax=Flavivirga algicola TaxID=2729136 RepID=A0ABX1S596_9FLAO|nr:MarR family winged helix-turn-helix transcriptional regulator [Flavivirga algicola]NMH89842.1 winged helix-turn-helix transcriptional regulator [Flavivirga algicola]